MDYRCLSFFKTAYLYSQQYITFALRTIDNSLNSSFRLFAFPYQIVSQEIFNVSLSTSRGYTLDGGILYRYTHFLISKLIERFIMIIEKKQICGVLCDKNTHVPDRNGLNGVEIWGTCKGLVVSMSWHLEQWCSYCDSFQWSFQHTHIRNYIIRSVSLSGHCHESLLSKQSHVLAVLYIHIYFFFFDSDYSKYIYAVCVDSILLLSTIQCAGMFISLRTNKKKTCDALVIIWNYYYYYFVFIHH